MTVIAWDGKTLAADKRAVTSGLARTVTKILRHQDKLLGASGTFDNGNQMVEWFKGGCDPEKFPRCQSDKDDYTILVVVDSNGLRIYEKGPYPLLMEDPFFAAGSGRDYAIAAMHLGCSASEAVSVACKFDTSCGNGIDELVLVPCET